MTGEEKRLEMAKMAGMKFTKDKGRKWLLVDCKVYHGEHYKTTFHLLEGTPPRAYIVENRMRGFCTLLDMEGRPVGSAVGGDYGPAVWEKAKLGHWRMNADSKGRTNDGLEDR